MKLAIIFILSMYVCLASSSLPHFIRGKKFNRHAMTSSSSSIPEQYFDQRLDHFDESLTTTWKQRYWVNDQYFDYKSTSPVFILIGGEGAENPIWLTQGQWVNYAKEHNALLVDLEHRFYGKSQPTIDMSVENLVYLSSEQALADLAAFRTFIHKSYKLTDTNKWISFGGSYPGSLSAWFRLKYPHLVYGAISSSAPMNAIIDFSDYLVVVGQSIADMYGPSCVNAIRNATIMIQNLLVKNRAKLETSFKTCDSIKNNDIINFNSIVAGLFEGAVQYNNDNRAFEGAIDTDLNIQKLCSIITNTSIECPVDRYAAINSLFLDRYQQSCQDVSYASFVNQMKAVNWNESAAEGGRQWTYQTCTEFGFFQSTTSTQQPFGQTVPVDFYIQQCKDIFGSVFNYDLLVDSVAKTNRNYGGYDYQASRVLFVNGRVDPWHALSFTDQAPNENTSTIFINGTAHCANMYPSADTDLPQLVNARKQISEQIAKWLSQ